MSRAYTNDRAKILRKIDEAISHLPPMTNNLKDILTPFDTILGLLPKDKRPHTMIGLTELPFINEACIYDAPCEVRPSTYGRGVFATRDIKIGDLITLYPAHGVSFNRIKSYATYTGDIEYDTTYTVEHDENDMAFVGDKDKFTPLFMGHLLNDNYPNVEEFKDKEKLGATVMKYLLHAMTLANCKFKDGKNFVIIQAIKDIKKDEELLVSYGMGYWGDDESKKADEPSQTVEAFEKYNQLLWRTDRKKAKFISDLILADVEKQRRINSM